jgi:hypothetical protein
LTGERPAASLGVLFDRMAGEVSAFRGLTWAGLGDTGGGVPVGGQAT